MASESAPSRIKQRCLEVMRMAWLAKNMDRDELAVEAARFLSTRYKELQTKNTSK